MVFKLNRTGSVLNRNERLNFNENWDKLEGVIKDRGLEILSESGFLTWLEKNGIKHREEVATFADLPSNDYLNTVRGVLEDNKIYIKKENGWVPFQSIDINKINDVESRVYDNLNDRRILATDPPIPHVAAKGDGVTDDTQALNNLVQAFSEVLLPPLKYKVTDTIRLGRNGKALVGLSENVRGYQETPIIFYDGVLDRKKTVVLLGTNDVGAEPTTDCSNNSVKNIKIDANYKAGFCIYGTYLTNETKVDNVILEKSLEYNGYFARGWYATLINITSMHCKGKGVAFGMPLEYQNGEAVNWSTSSPLELNNVKIDNIRSIHSGEYYKIDNPGLYNPRNEDHRRQGYGIGAGIGNGFRLQNFLSERSGGANLYVYTGAQPSKTIENGYLERATEYGGLDPSSEMPNIIIENTSIQGGKYNIRDIFMNYDSGGIFHVGEKRVTVLENIYQPRFLKSLDGLENYELFQFVIKNNVYYLAGYTNTDEALARDVVIEEVNTRYSFDVFTPPIKDGQKMIFFKKTDDNPLLGGFSANLEDGEVRNYLFPDNINKDDWTFGRMLVGDTERITKSGGTGDISAHLKIKIVSMPATH